jgi:hypothetical protein
MMEPAQDVEARFAEDSHVTVRRFTWRGRRHAVARQGRQWQAPDGRHVLVMTADERAFELLYDGANWRATSISARASAA